MYRRTAESIRQQKLPAGFSGGLALKPKLLLQFYLFYHIFVPLSIVYAQIVPALLQIIAPRRKLSTPR